MNKTNAPDRNRTCNPRLRRSVLYPVELRALMPIRAEFFVWSGRWDSNSRPSAPKADALTGLRYAPTRRSEIYRKLYFASSVRTMFFIKPTIPFYF